MKKLLGLLLLLFLVACGSDTGSGASAQPTDTPSPQPISDEAAGPGVTSTDTGYYCHGDARGITTDATYVYIVCDSSGDVNIVKVPKSSLK